MAKFSGLLLTEHYDIIDGESGHHLTQGIAGAEAMIADWPDEAEAWHAGETEFKGAPVEIAE